MSIDPTGSVLPTFTMSDVIEQSVDDIANYSMLFTADSGIAPSDKLICTTFFNSNGGMCVVMCVCRCVCDL